MDVRCGRCGTEYEFDDALISERGTTVKCTNCGYQFKVFPDTAAAAPERWLVRTLAGRELVYTTLGDLQRGIAKGHVGAQDLLSRGNRPPRPLSAIPELDSFLRGTGSARRAARTLYGVAPAANLPSGGNTPALDAPSIDPEPPVRAATPAPRQARDTPAMDTTLPIEPMAPVAAELELAATAPVVPVVSELMPPVPARAAHSGAAAIQSRTSPVVNPSMAHGPVGYTAEAPPSAEPLPATPLASETSTEAAPSPRPDKPARDLAAARLLLQHDDQTDPQYTHIPMRRHAHSRWLVFVVVLAAGGLLAATVGKRYLAKYTTPGGESAVASSDSRVIKLLEEGDQLIREGKPQGAKQAYFKAHALANQDPRVLTSLARLEVLSADFAWLKLRLLDPQDKTGIELTHRELGARVGRTERAVGALKQVAPEALATQQLMVHAKRLSGKVEQARAQVGAISKQASAPENAYVLAALDLAEASPVWSSIVHRLRIAAASEGNTGQARAALIYALTRSGQNGAAQTELDKLSQNTASHPLLDDLQAFVKRHAAAEDAGPDAAATVDPGELPDLDTTEQSGDGAAASTDFRAQLKQAHGAAERGQLGTAERLYNSVLSSHPGNTEALAGLADIATRRNESGRASELYAKVLEKNPSYLPALIANADQKWAAGDKPAALELYRRIIDQAGAGSSYGQRAARRIAQAEQERKTGDLPAAGDKDADNTEADSETPTGEEAPESPPDTDSGEESTPHIDTTDLPEFNR